MMILDLTLQNFIRLRNSKGLQFIYNGIKENLSRVIETNCLISSNFDGVNIIDISQKSGELTGAPIVVKDNIVTKGILTTAGSRILAGFIPPYDATAVKKLKDAGCIIVGKANLDEFGMGSKNKNSAFGPCLNPWDLDRVPGGSSGGSAVAVASRICVAALGSDTGGSVRLPASFCGCYGLKPTYGRVSRYGLVAFGSSLDCIGIFASDVNTTKTILDIISGFDENDETSVNLISEPKAPRNRIGFLCLDEFKNEIDPEVLLVYFKTIDFFRGKGFQVEELKLDFLKYVIPCYYVICTAEAASNLSRYDGLRYGTNFSFENEDLECYYSSVRSEGFGDEVKRRILLGNFVLSAGYQGKYYFKALKLRRRIFNMMEEVFSKVDILLTPTSPILPPKVNETQTVIQEYLMDIFTVIANLCGYPALSFPAGFSSSNLPIGIQILGGLFSEDVILHYAGIFESENNFNSAVPPILLK